MNKSVVVIHKDGQEEEFYSATSAAINISVSTVRLRLRNGEPYSLNKE